MPHFCVTINFWIVQRLENIVKMKRIEEVLKIYGSVLSGTSYTLPDHWAANWGFCASCITYLCITIYMELFQSLRNKPASATKASLNMEQHFTLRLCNYEISEWSFELIPTASIVSIKYEVCNLKCKFKTVDGILMFWKQRLGTEHEVIHSGIPEGSLSQTSRQVHKSPDTPLSVWKNV